jgi:hypothetical protein
VTDLDPPAFARLRLTGGRFEESNGMPVETLPELSAYRDLLLGVAKALFKREHPQRQRVPRGFADRLRLRLRVVEDGSTMPVLERPAPSSQLVAADDDFTRARDVIEDAVTAVAQDDDLPPTFPPEALILFNRFGQTLRYDEAIELRRADAQTGPAYTPDVRRKLILKQRRTIQAEIDDLAWVTEVDADRMSCSIRLRNMATTISAPLDEITFASARDVLEPRGEGPAVRIRGIGVQDIDGNLLRLDDIHEITVFEGAEDFARLDARLDELMRIRRGWLNGEGEEVDPSIAQTLQSAVGQLLLAGAPLPRIYPTPAGGLQAEWSDAGREISIAFEPGEDPYAIAVDVASGDYDEPSLATGDFGPVASLLAGDDD